MNRLSVRTTVFGGAALGLVAGAAVFGAVSSSATSPAPLKPGLVSVGTVPAASCAAGQELEHGVCVVHVEKVVVIPAPASVQAQGSAEGSLQDISSADDDATETSDDATEISDDATETSDDATEISDDATETSDDAEEAAHEALEHASEAGDVESHDSAELESADHS